MRSVVGANGHDEKSERTFEKSRHIPYVMLRSEATKHLGGVSLPPQILRGVYPERCRRTQNDIPHILCDLHQAGGESHWTVPRVNHWCFV